MMAISRLLSILTWLAALLLAGVVMPVAQNTEDPPCFSVPESPSEPGGWRRNWEVRLRTIPADPIIPDTIIVTIVNRCPSDTLRGDGPYLHLFGLDGYAEDPALPLNNIVLGPRDSLVYRRAFRTLTMTGYSRRVLDTTLLFARMREIPWTLGVDIVDNHSPKPWLESTYLVRANLIQCNAGASKEQ